MTMKLLSKQKRKSTTERQRLWND
uniref:Uncharacterized protein n=1 Tax=Rhizophora mucronata TaxID=61149 RepID=A0A2P2KGX6_RHIMU